MAVGDTAFFYHSNIGKEIVGIVKVVRAAYPDPSAESGDWVCVDMQAVRPFKHFVTLAAMKADPALEGLALLKLLAAVGSAGGGGVLGAYLQAGVVWRRGEARQAVPF